MRPLGALDREENSRFNCESNEMPAKPKAWTRMGEGGSREQRGWGRNIQYSISNLQFSSETDVGRLYLRRGFFEQQLQQFPSTMNYQLSTGGG
jgi:hypothetical protein